MYRAVELAPKDWDLHRFVWRTEPTSDIRDYLTTRVTYGVSASPYLAVQSLHQTATDFGKDHLLAAPRVYNSFYVYDCLPGAETPDQAINLQRDLYALLQKGGFQLTKWRSNSFAVMTSIPSELHDPSHTKTINEGKDDPSPKALGIHWSTTQDKEFVSTGTILDQELTTKRMITSDIVRTFDVLGWFAPSTVVMKILLQNLWELHLNWDEELPSNLRNQPATWKSQLHLLADKDIERCYFRKDDTTTSIQLHGFTDASEAAYAAVIYLRATYTAYPPTVTLVSVKTKVAPLKRLTIPRLELCGTQLLAKLANAARKALNISTDQTTLWADSTIVLHWLDGSPRRYKAFVGNRISHILELFLAHTWKYVPTACNPAGCASRGLLPQELVDHSLW